MDGPLPKITVSRTLPYCLTQNLYFSLGSCKILVKFEFCYARQRVQLCENPEPHRRPQMIPDFD